MLLPPAETLSLLFPRSLEGGSAHQRQLASRITTTGSPGRPKIVAGVDVAYAPERSTLYAAAVAFDAQTRRAVASGSHVGPIELPYVPGFLSYREGPAIVEALRALDAEPDLLLCDGHGVAHPRRLGIASHLSLAIGIPTVGVAKSVLVGTYEEPGRERGARSPLVHRGEELGVALRTRSGVKPVFVSVGNGLSLACATRFALQWSGRVKLPEPVHAADRLVARLRRGAGGHETPKRVQNEDRRLS